MEEINKDMTPEELMKPRYKVIADYPESKFDIGDILTPCEIKGLSHLFESVKIKRVSTPEKFPHLFRKLEWWEERDIKDLPEYVKAANKVWNVDRWLQYFGWHPRSNQTEDANYDLELNWHFHKDIILPATKEEFKSQ